MLEAGKTQWERCVGPAVPARWRPWMVLAKARLLFSPWAWLDFKGWKELLCAHLWGSKWLLAEA